MADGANPPFEPSPPASPEIYALRGVRDTTAKRPLPTALPLIESQRDGDPLFFTVVPKRLRLRAGTATTVWGVLPDSLDVPSVIRYRVTGGPGSVGLSGTLRAPG
jgi:hypothetical protein